MDIAKHPRATDWTGARIGHLTVLRAVGRKPNLTIIWEIQCDCGKIQNSEASSFSQRLKNGTGVCSSSCRYARHGKRKRHGKYATPEYRSWTRMKSRCNQPGNASYARYGGRGIQVCARWQKNFQNFLDDMGTIPEKGMSLDRIDVNGNYCPENCRWATSKEQGNNRNDNRIIDTPWGRMTATLAAEKAGLAPYTVLRRLRAGISGEELFRKTRKNNVKWDTQWGPLTVTEASARAGICRKLAWSRIASGMTDPARIFSSELLH